MDREDVFAFARELMIARYGQDFVHDLISEDPETAAHAAQEFYDILYNQGDIYPESLKAIPHLVLALSHSQPAVKESFIYLLGGIATGNHSPSGDILIIPKATVGVLENRDKIEAFLLDENLDVRLAALITLTDLARLNHPKMDYGKQTPAFLGALPKGVSAQDLSDRLEHAIDQSKSAFDSDWRQHCEVALAYLSFVPTADFPDVPVHPYWSSIDRHSLY